jgi:hypothetical protein
MKIKEDLILRNIAGSWVVIPMGERLLEFSGMMQINDTGAFIWRLLEKGAKKEDLISAILDEYEIDEAAAAAEVDDFLRVLGDAQVLEV